MKAIENFIGSLIGIMLYSALIQYSDTGTVDLVELILTPEAWFIAFGVTAGIAIWRSISNDKDVGEVKV